MNDAIRDLPSQLMGEQESSCPQEPDSVNDEWRARR